MTFRCCRFLSVSVGLFTTFSSGQYSTIAFENGIPSALSDTSLITLRAFRVAHWATFLLLIGSTGIVAEAECAPLSISWVDEAATSVPGNFACRLAWWSWHPSQFSSVCVCFVCSGKRFQDSGEKVAMYSHRDSGGCHFLVNWFSICLHPWSNLVSRCSCCLGYTQKHVWTLPETVLACFP